MNPRSLTIIVEYFHVSFDREERSVSLVKGVVRTARLIFRGSELSMCNMFWRKYSNKHNSFSQHLKSWKRKENRYDGRGGEDPVVEVDIVGALRVRVQA